MASERNGLGRHPSWRGGRAKGAAGLSGCGKQRRVCPGGASGPPPSSPRLHPPLGREATGACTSRCCPWSACWLGSGTQQSGPSPPLYKIKKTGLFWSYDIRAWVSLNLLRSPHMSIFLSNEKRFVFDPNMRDTLTGPQSDSLCAILFFRILGSSTKCLVMIIKSIQKVENEV